MSCRNCFLFQPKNAVVDNSLTFPETIEELFGEEQQKDFENLKTQRNDLRHFMSPFFSRGQALLQAKSLLTQFHFLGLQIIWKELAERNNRQYWIENEEADYQQPEWIEEKNFYDLAELIVDNIRPQDLLAFFLPKNKKEVIKNERQKRLAFYCLSYFLSAEKLATLLNSERKAESCVIMVDYWLTERFDPQSKNDQTFLLYLCQHKFRVIREAAYKFLWQQKNFVLPGIEKIAPEIIKEVRKKKGRNAANAYDVWSYEEFCLEKIKPHGELSTIANNFFNQSPILLDITMDKERILSLLLQEGVKLPFERKGVANWVAECLIRSVNLADGLYPQLIEQISASPQKEAIFEQIFTTFLNSRQDGYLTSQLKFDNDLEGWNNFRHLLLHFGGEKEFQQIVAKCAKNFQFNEQNQKFNWFYMGAQLAQKLGKNKDFSEFSQKAFQAYKDTDYSSYNYFPPFFWLSPDCLDYQAMDMETKEVLYDKPINGFWAETQRNGKILTKRVDLALGTRNYDLLAELVDPTNFNGYIAREKILTELQGKENIPEKDEIREWYTSWLISGEKPAGFLSKEGANLSKYPVFSEQQKTKLLQKTFEELELAVQQTESLDSHQFVLIKKWGQKEDLPKIRKIAQEYRRTYEGTLGAEIALAHIRNKKFQKLEKK